MVVLLVMVVVVVVVVVMVLVVVVLVLMLLMVVLEYTTQNITVTQHDTTASRPTCMKFRSSGSLRCAGGCEVPAISKDCRNFNFGVEQFKKGSTKILQNVANSLSI